MTLRNEEPHVNKCFPRIRGDVPVQLVVLPAQCWFSPHTRGCSPGVSCAFNSSRVFPAYAGMFPTPLGGAPPATCFPRIRGDVPFCCCVLRHSLAFSPHTRGCSHQNLTHTSESSVFPAYAGMFRPRWRLSSHRWSFPRIRGDVPSASLIESSVTRFSPHTRGCSVFHRPR